MVSRDTLLSGWCADFDVGKFVIPKHDPTEKTLVWKDPRTVLSTELYNNLSGFLHSGEFSINVYADKAYPKNSGFYEVIPTGTPPFNVAGSGVTPNVSTPSGDYDRLVVVWGPSAGWHCHAGERQLDCR
jgi:hypothetical protein